MLADISLGLRVSSDIYRPLGRSIVSLQSSRRALYAYLYKPLMATINNDNFKVLYFSLEMNRMSLFVKLLSIYIFETFGIQLSFKKILSRERGYILDDDSLESASVDIRYNVNTGKKIEDESEEDDNGDQENNNENDTRENTDTRNSPAPSASPSPSPATSPTPTPSVTPSPTGEITTKVTF